MPIYKVSLAFAELPDPDLDAFTENVLAKMRNNTHYPDPPETLDDVQTALTDFTTKLSAAAGGGKQATAAKDASREVLVGMLREIATYVQGMCKNDLTVLLSSGYDATNNNRAQTPLPAPTILKVTNEATTELALKVSPVDNAHSYEVRLSVNGGAPQSGGVFTQARKIVLTGLLPGTTYSIQVRAIGGSTGYSPWSEPVSHMAT